jgi:hypothetical protein
MHLNTLLFRKLCRSVQMPFQAGEIFPIIKWQVAIRSFLWDLLGNSR